LLSSNELHLRFITVICAPPCPRQIKSGGHVPLCAPWCRHLCCFVRNLADGNTRAGMEQIANCFVFEAEKLKAMDILHTVSITRTLISLARRTQMGTTIQHFCQLQLLLPGAFSFDHQTISSALSCMVYVGIHVPVHVLEIEYSLLQDHAFGTVFLRMCVDLICA